MSVRLVSSGWCESRVRRSGLVVASIVLVAAGSCGAPVAAQSVVTRKVATVEALVTYPTFFHTQPVRVRGELRARDGSVWLVSQAHEVEVVGPAAAGQAGAAAQRVQVTGTLIDPGRLEAGDPRLRGVDVAALSQARLRKPWPGIGELLLLLADEVIEAVVLGPVVHPGAGPGPRAVRRSERHAGRALPGAQSLRRSAHQPGAQPMGLRARSRRRLRLGHGPAPSRRQLRPRHRGPGRRGPVGGGDGHGPGGPWTGLPRRRGDQAGARAVGGAGRRTRGSCAGRGSTT